MDQRDHEQQNLGPHQVYSARLRRNEENDRQLERRSLQLSVARLLLVVAGISLAWLATESHLLHPAWIVVPVAAFVVLVLIHRRVALAQARARRCVAHYRAGLRRLEDDWAGNGVAGEGHKAANHPYADDLDILGHGSLFELLCTARTLSGERILASWLLAPAGAEEIAERQQVIKELRAQVDLREQVALLGEDISSALDPEALERWAAGPPRHARRAVRGIAVVLHLLVVLSIAGWLFLGWGPVPLALVAVAHSVFILRTRSWVTSVTAAVRRPATELALLAELLTTIGTQGFVSPLLIRLQRSLASHGVPPEGAITRLERLVQLLDSRNNLIFAPFAAMLLWDFYIAGAMERWRMRHGGAIGTWFEVVGAFEALMALACFSFEHPRDPFPEIAEPGQAIEAEALAHPLLPEDQAVPNDVALGADHRVLIVSGSNMAGKSTLLRTLGCNAVLALAGATVRARRFRLPPLEVGASIRKQDSLLGGRSGFFAEISRLRQIADMCDGPHTVLFLLDEIFHGTNSHDRRVGAEHLVRRFLAMNAMGLLTTHDLALARLADSLAPMVGNVHFEDSIVGGEVCFDYLLRPGPVQRGNALELLRAVGLMDEPRSS